MQKENIVVKDVANNLESYSKSITTVLDKLGLLGFKYRNNSGMYYKITFESFQELIQQTHQNINFATLPTLPTQNNSFVEYDEVKINSVGNKINSVGNVENKKVSVANVGNVASVGQLKGVVNQKINLSEQVKAYILEFDKGFGCKTEEIVRFVQNNGYINPLQINETISNMKEQGLVYEIKPNIWSVDFINY